MYSKDKAWCVSADPSRCRSNKVHRNLLSVVLLTEQPTWARQRGRWGGAALLEAAVLGLYGLQARGARPAQMTPNLAPGPSSQPVHIQHLHQVQQHCSNIVSGLLHGQVNRFNSSYIRYINNASALLNELEKTPCVRYTRHASALLHVAWEGHLVSALHAVCCSTSSRAQQHAIDAIAGDLQGLQLYRSGTHLFGVRMSEVGRADTLDQLLQAQYRYR